VSNLTYRAADAKAQSASYTAALVEALGTRDPLDVLRETPAALRAGTVRVTSVQLVTPEAPGKCSILQVLQHLNDSELVAAYRIRMVLASERPPLIGYDQDHWGAHLHVGDDDVEELLVRFGALRHTTVRLLEAATPAERERVGLHEERGEESVARMMSLLAGHDVVHLRQLARIRRAVGAG
jgi:hypothetical protein